MKTAIATLLTAATLTAFPLAAAPTTHAFDAVTAVDMHSSNAGIAGLAKDTLAPLAVNFVDVTNISFRYVVNRCLPLFITAMEKPGRYFLYVTVDPAEPNVQLRGCRLELKGT